MSLTKTQSKIIKELRQGGIIIPHIKHDGKKCFRLMNKKSSPIKNISEFTVRKLENKDRIINVKGRYKYKSLREMAVRERNEYKCSYNGTDWWLVPASSFGKAKYKFWKEVREKIDPTILYTKIRTQLFKKQKE